MAPSSYFISENILIDQLFLNTQTQCKFIIAIDEVGRGCVAGPVVVCASLWIQSAEKTNNWVSLVKDSKKLSAIKRLACYNKVLEEFGITNTVVPIKNFHSIPSVHLVKPRNTLRFANNKQPQKNTLLKCIGFCLGEGSIAEVEQFNIWNAVQIASARALLGIKEFYLRPLSATAKNTTILMDGNKSLSVPESFLNVVQVTAIKGDDLFISVGLSSILAKVYRDLFMQEQEHIFPNYGFANHKGYGTALHMENIQKHGLCPLHRPSFLKKILLIN